MSDQNRIRLISKQPIRGKILDKNGKVLVNNKLIYSLIIKPQFIERDNWISYKFKLSKLLNINADELQKNYDLALRSQNYSIAILDELNTEQLIKFEENEKEFSGIEISKTVIRNYPYK